MGLCKRETKIRRRRVVPGTGAGSAENLLAAAPTCMDAGMRQPGFFPSFSTQEVDAGVTPAPVSRELVFTQTPQGGASGAERRQSGGRARARDRLMDRMMRAPQESDPLSRVRGVENLVLFIDDDLRETAMALGNVENYLMEILKLLEAPRLAREEVHALAADTQVLDHVDMLVETLETLRRRLAKLSASLR